MADEHPGWSVPRPAGGVAAGIDALIGRVRGPVFVSDNDGYDTERAGFQTAVQHRPAVIVGATGAADVRAAVEFAGANRLPVAVQGTGHALLSVAAEGGVLITTCRMTGVRVEADGRTAWLESGVRWEQVIHEAAPHGLAPLSGSAPDVGAVSYALGGGLGLLSRRYGYAADHVRTIATSSPPTPAFVTSPPKATRTCSGRSAAGGTNSTTEQVRTAYDPDDYRRLAELKAVYDPTNTFRLNHNIPPATQHDSQSGSDTSL